MGKTKVKKAPRKRTSRWLKYIKKFEGEIRERGCENIFPDCNIPDDCKVCPWKYKKMKSDKKEEEDGKKDGKIY